MRILTTSLLSILLMCCGLSEAKQIQAVMIDSGFTQKNNPSIKICPNGLFDLTGTGIQDTLGHGSNLLGIYERELVGVDYCLYIFKVYDKSAEFSSYIHMQAFLKSLYLEHIKVINYSSYGKSYSNLEASLVKQLIDLKIIFVSSAGNDGKNLDIKCFSFPGCLPGVVMVGNLNGKEPQQQSNYGNVIKFWEQGTNVCAGGYCMTGTSQATALHSAKLIKKLYSESIKGK